MWGESEERLQLSNTVITKAHKVQDCCSPHSNETEAVNDITSHLITKAKNLGDVLEIFLFPTSQILLSLFSNFNSIPTTPHMPTSTLLVSVIVACAT